MGDPSRLGSGHSHRLITARFRWYGVSNFECGTATLRRRRDRRLLPVRARGRIGFSTLVCAPVIDGNLGAVA